MGMPASPTDVATTNSGRVDAALFLASRPRRKASTEVGWPIITAANSARQDFARHLSGPAAMSGPTSRSLGTVATSPLPQHRIRRGSGRLISRSRAMRSLLTYWLGRMATRDGAASIRAKTA